MKFIIIRSNLKEGISAVERAAGEHLNLPILKNILFETEGNKIKITATNLEIAITYAVTGKVIEEGKFTAPAGILGNLVNNLQSDRLNIEENKGKLEIKTDNYEAKVQGLPADDFPIMPKIKNQKESIEIKGVILKNGLEQALVAAQFSEIRPELNSVFFKFSLNNLKIVATDSFRLAERTIPSEQFTAKLEKEFSILIPLKTAQELSRIIRDDDTVNIYRDENQVLFKTASMELLSRLSEGTFPDYAAIIPQKFDAEMIFNRQEFMNALKLAGVFGNKSGEVKLVVQENKKAVELISSDQTLGENNYMLPVKAHGTTDAIVFNWRYLADALKTLKTEDVFLGVNNANNPAMIKSPGDASYLYILKPIAE
ncbi:MAG TPA: DNA polymerase III subunit beta [Candidatus Paceibacterota bacterium]|nr:DNA polymerase III subunit beta [Candidatus Paceibacterota bacterium]